MVVGRGSVSVYGCGGGYDCGSSDAGCGSRYNDHGCDCDDRSGIAIVMGMIILFEKTRPSPPDTSVRW